MADPIESGPVECAVDNGFEVVCMINDFTIPCEFGRHAVIDTAFVFATLLITMT